MLKHWGNYTLPVTSTSFYIKQHAMALGLFKITKLLTIVPYAANSSFADNSKFTYTIANVIISRTRVIYLNNNSTLTGGWLKEFFKAFLMGQAGLFSPESPI